MKLFSKSMVTLLLGIAFITSAFASGANYGSSAKGKLGDSIFKVINYTTHDYNIYYYFDQQTIPQSIYLAPYGDPLHRDVISFSINYPSYYVVLNPGIQDRQTGIWVANGNFHQGSYVIQPPSSPNGKPSFVKIN